MCETCEARLNIHGRSIPPGYKSPGFRIPNHSVKNLNMSKYRKRKGTGPYKKRPYKRMNTYVARSMAAEKKFNDTELLAEGISEQWLPINPTTLNCISAVAQGDGPNERIGRKYQIVTVMVNGFVESQAAEAQANIAGQSWCRILFVLDRQTNGVESVGGQVMDITFTDRINSFRNLEFAARYQVLADVRLHFDPQIVNEGTVDSFASGHCVKWFTMRHTFKKPLVVICNGVGNTVAAVTDNSLSIIAIDNGVLVNDLTYYG